MFGKQALDVAGFNFCCVDEEKVIRVIKSLRTKTSSGDNGDSCIDLKDGIYYTSCMITAIFNMIVITGHRPVGWKNSIKTPVQRGGGHLGPLWLQASCPD